MLQTNINANINMLQTNINANTNGNIGVLGFFIPKTLVIWAYPSHITLGIWVRVRVRVGVRVRVRVTGYANTMGMPKTRGCPYDCDSGVLQSGLGWVVQSWIIK